MKTKYRIKAVVNDDAEIVFEVQARAFFTFGLWRSLADGPNAWSEHRFDSIEEASRWIMKRRRRDSKIAEAKKMTRQGIPIKSA